MHYTQKLRTSITIKHSTCANCYHRLLATTYIFSYISVFPFCDDKPVIQSSDKQDKNPT